MPRIDARPGALRRRAAAAAAAALATVLVVLAGGAAAPLAAQPTAPAPATEPMWEEQAPTGMPVGATLLHTPWGWLAVGGWATADDDAQVGSRQVLLVRPGAPKVTAELSVGRFNAQAVVLTDGSVLVIGGTARYRRHALGTDNNTRRTTAVDRIVWRNARLEVSRAADLPGPPRRGFALVALADGRALVAGGTEVFYKGCMACVADTHLFDPATGQWQTVAPMAHGRVDFSATRLADGRVLAAGGWSTRGQDADDLVEAFDPTSGRWLPFPSLPAPVAQHRAVWLPGEAGRTLLVGGGTNLQVQALDVKRRQWSTVAEALSYRVGAQLAPYRDADGRPWVALSGGVHNPRGQNPDADPSIERLALMPVPPSPAATQRAVAGTLDGDRVVSMRFRRHEPALAIGSDGRALIAGGMVEADPSWVSTASADLIRPGGTTAHALPAMQHARAGAQALWLADGRVAVLGGQKRGLAGGRRAHLDFSGEGLPIEFFDLATMQWSQATGAGQVLRAPADAVYDVAPNGDLIEATREAVVRLQVRGNVVTRHEMPSPWLPHAGDASVRALADGRIVLAGGYLDAHMIGRPGQPGQYARRGGSALARRHEVFDPATGRWTPSAALDFGATWVAILDDGRVAALGETREGEERDGRWIPPVLTLALSDAQGQSWQRVALPPGLVPRQGDAWLTVQQGELLLHSPMEGDKENTHAAWSFDPATSTWAEITRWRQRGNAMQVLSVTTPRGRRVVLATR